MVMMDSSRRSTLVTSLNDVSETEEQLKAKYTFLQSALMKRFKVNSANTGSEAELSTMNGILIKKLLEYKEIRNYSVMECDEEEKSKLKLMQTCNESKCKVFKIIEGINRKQNVFNIDCSPANMKYLKKLQELTKLYSSDLRKLCQSIAEKSNVKIKNVILKENFNRKRVRTGKLDEIEYNKLVLTKKELEDLLFRRQKELNEMRKKIESLNNNIKQLKLHNSTKTQTNFDKLTYFVNIKMEKLKKECNDVKILKKKYSVSKKILDDLKEKSGNIIYTNLQEDCKDTEDKISLLQNQLYQMTTFFNKHKSPPKCFQNSKLKL